MFRKGISIERLKSLSVVKRCATSKEAAEELGVKAPLISKQLKELEEALGIDLKQGKKLTEAGSELAEITQSFLRDFKNFELRHVDKVETITIGAGEGVLQWVVIPLVVAQLSKEEQKRVRFKNMRSKECAKAVESGEVDLGFFDKVHLSEESLIKKSQSKCYGRCLVKRVTAADSEVKDWAELEGGNLSTLEGQGETRRIVEGLCEKYPEGPQITLECSSYTQIIESCRVSDEFIGVVPQIAKGVFHGAAKDDTLQFIDISELSEKKVELVGAYHDRGKKLVERIVELYDKFVVNNV